MSTIFFVLFFLSFTSCVLSTKDDEIALLKIKKQLHNPDTLRSWKKGFNFCDVSISTSSAQVYTGCTRTGRVNSLILKNFDFTAPFPRAICDLTKLEYLALAQIPGLYGPLPSCITKILSLRYFIILQTSLSGSVPNFYKHKRITTINLADNRLSGTIPPSLSTLPNLEYLDLSSNYLTGTIPPGLVHGPFPSLILSNNNLTGELPKCYGWVDFKIIDVGNNRLCGDASFLFGEQKKSVNIVLANNEFEFDLSPIKFSDNLHAFDLSHNKIYGFVPESFANAAELWHPNLSFNNLCGPLPLGGNMWRFKAAVFENNHCYCVESSLVPCSYIAPVSALAPSPI